MKAYPLIYSRTQKADFVPDFLVRPADLDYQRALGYVRNAMTNLDISNVIRYCAFSVGTYHICGGISCISKQLVATLGSSFDNVAEYLADEKGRKVACFIGFAIPDEEAKPGIIPDITLSDYWDYYLEYLKHQWKSVATKSEILTLPCIDLKEKPYIAKNMQSAKSIARKNIIQNFSGENRQAILENYFDRILNQKEDVSFLSDVSSKNEWDELVFTDVSVSDNLYRCLTSASRSTTTTHEDNIGSALPEWSVPTHEKKTDLEGNSQKHGATAAILTIAAILVFVILILLVKKIL